MVNVSHPLPPNSTEVGSVRVIYAIPSDNEFNQVYADSIQAAIENVQKWYQSELGGPTFYLHGDEPEVCHLDEDEEWFLKERESDVMNVWRTLVNELQDCLPVRGGREEHHWVVYADIDECAVGGPPFGLGRGWNGLTMLGAWDLKGLTDREFVQCGWSSAYPLGRWQGGLAHELAHTWNIRHPPGCDAREEHCDKPALMSAGYTTYPDTYFRDDDKQILLRAANIIDAARNP